MILFSFIALSSCAVAPIPERCSNKCQAQEKRVVGYDSKKEECICKTQSEIELEIEKSPKLWLKDPKY